MRYVIHNFQRYWIAFEVASFKMGKHTGECLLDTLSVNVVLLSQGWPQALILGPN